MSAVTTENSFYVQHPRDSYWRNGITNCVIEARVIDPADTSLYDWERTDSYVKEHLKIISPEEHTWHHILKNEWIECSGPSRTLTPLDYIRLVHSLRPEIAFPKGLRPESSLLNEWKEHKSKE